MIFMMLKDIQTLHTAMESVRHQEAHLAKLKICWLIKNSEGEVEGQQLSIPDGHLFLMAILDDRVVAF